jgi:YggT family protein
METIVDLVSAAFEVYQWLLIARLIISFFPAPIGRSFWAQLYDFIVEVTEPVLAPIRRIVPIVQMGAVGFDFSIPIAYFLVGLAERALVNLIYNLLV